MSAPLPASMRAVQGRVRIFDSDPDLLEGVDEQTAAVLLQRGTAPRLAIEPGPWEPPLGGAACGWLGLLVLDGVLVRKVTVGGTTCREVLGPGDLLRPWERHEGTLVEEATWSALTRAGVAVLDDEFAAAITQSPAVVSALLGRAVMRSRSLTIALAIVHMRRAEPRLYALLWHLADRFGRVTTSGVHLPLRLTHETLADLASLRRPSASTTLARMTREGLLERRGDGTWLITGAPPDDLSGQDDALGSSPERDLARSADRREVSGGRCPG